MIFVTFNLFISLMRSSLFFMAEKLMNPRLLSDLETDRKGSQSWHSWFLDDVQNLDIHAVRAKMLRWIFA